MPLFPAYAQPEENYVPPPEIKKESGSPWRDSLHVESVNETNEVVSVKVEREDVGSSSLSAVKDESSDSSSEDERRKRKKRKHERRKHEKKERKKKKKRRSASRERKPSQDVKEEMPLIAKGTVFSNGLNLRPSQAFYVDQKGDKNNLAFPNLYYKYVPRYVSVNGALGGRITKKMQAKRRAPPRYFGKRAIKRLTAPAAPVKINPTNLISERNPLGVYDLGTVMYVQGCGPVDSNKDESPVNQDEDGIKRKNAEFNRKLKEEPHNIKLWLEFIEFQDSPEAQRLAGADHSQLTSKEKQGKHLHKRALLERKVSILDKAIELNPKNIELITSKMLLASEFWDAGVLQQEWKRLLFVHPMAVDLWKTYLFFNESYFEGFSVHSVLKAYSGCFQKMIQMQHPSFSSHQRPDHLEEHMIDMVTRLCLFLRQTGATEKSISVYQALIELGLDKHKKYPRAKENLRSVLPTLQSFWDSRVPRFGEDSTGPEEAICRVVHGNDVSDVEDAIVQSGKPHAVVWREVENLRSLQQWQAWTSSPESEEEPDDPERIVGFGDVSPFLFATEKSAELQYRLVVGFLQSLGVPLYPSIQAQLFWAPIAPVDDLFHLVPTCPTSIRLPNVAPTLLDSPSYLNWLRRIVSQSFTVLADPYRMELALWWFHVERTRIMAMAAEQSALGPAWKETKRWMKSLLKDVPMQDVVSTLLLYGAYADVEYAAGNREECGRVLQMVLSMHNSNPLLLSNADDKRNALMHTWLLYLLYLINSNSHDAALAHLVSLGSGSPFHPKPAAPTPALHLKAKRKYESLYQQLLAEPDALGSTSKMNLGLFNHPDFIVDFLACYSYFISFTEGCLSAHKLVTQWLDRHLDSNQGFQASRRFDPKLLRYHSRRELIYTDLLRLVSRCNAWVKDVQPRLFHDTLLTSWSEYRLSFRFLALFIESEEQCSTFSHLWNRLISTAKSKSNESSGAAVAACLALARRGQNILEAEERAWRTSDDTTKSVIHPGYHNRIQHLAEHCVSQYPGRHSPILWRILMRLANLRGDWQRCKALFYRAARDCPWSKDIFMDVVEYVPSMVKEVTGLLLEKDLRLRFPLEELDVLLEPEPDLEPANTETADVPDPTADEGSQEGNRQESDSDDDLSQDYDDESDV